MSFSCIKHIYIYIYSLTHSFTFKALFNANYRSYGDEHTSAGIRYILVKNVIFAYCRHQAHKGWLSDEGLSLETLDAVDKPYNVFDLYFYTAFAAYYFRDILFKSYLYNLTVLSPFLQFELQFQLFFHLFSVF